LGVGVGDGTAVAVGSGVDVGDGVAVGAGGAIGVVVQAANSRHAIIRYATGKYLIATPKGKPRICTNSTNWNTRFVKIRG